MTPQGDGLIRWTGSRVRDSPTRPPTPAITVALSNNELPFRYTGPARHRESSVTRATRRVRAWAKENEWVGQWLK
eukprot:11210330-Lingulodinium_polyedra.AAC.1